MNDNSLKDIKQQLIRLRSKEISGGLDEMEKRKKQVLQAKFEKLQENLNIAKYAEALVHKKDTITENEYNKLLLNGYKPDEIEKMIKEGTFKDVLKKAAIVGGVALAGHTLAGATVKAVKNLETPMIEKIEKAKKKVVKKKVTE